MSKSPCDFQSPAGRRDRRREVAGAPGGEDLGDVGEWALGERCRRLRTDDRALVALLTSLAPAERRRARIVMARELGPGCAAGLFRRAFGSTEVGLPSPTPSTVAVDAEAPDLRTRFDLAQARGLTDLLATLSANVAADQGLVGEGNGGNVGHARGPAGS